MNSDLYRQRFAELIVHERDVQAKLLRTFASPDGKPSVTGQLPSPRAHTR